MPRCCSIRRCIWPACARWIRDQQVLNQPTLTLDDLKNFRQLDSKTPGHPEFGLTAGVETTTGPLGQGVANSVGMAIASKWLGSYFNRPGFELFDYAVYALCGDGDMMEGISSEAASLAGHLKLGNLCWIYDSNRISIEGSTSLALSEDVGKRFEAYGWNVLHVADANDQAALDGALGNFRQCKDRPTFIVIESHIAFGAPTKQDTAAAHGEPLGDGEIKLTKKNYGWPEDEKFFVPEGVQENFATGSRQTRPRAARRVDREVCRVPEKIPRTRRAIDDHAAARTAGGLGQGIERISGRSKGPSDA